MSVRFGEGLVIGLCLFVSGCASTGASSQDDGAGVVSLVRAALAPAPSEMSAADSSIASAVQSLQYRFGLMGMPIDVDRADALRAASVGGAQPLVLTQYIPGLNGAPGRVVPLVIQQQNPLKQIMQQAELCGRALDGDPALMVWSNGVGGTSPSAVSACGGDTPFYELSQAWSEAKTWHFMPLPDCGEGSDDRCAALSRKIDRLNGRDPVAEAMTAAARGDFRLGAFNSIGPMPQGWRLPGVECRSWSRDMIGAWHVNQDVIRPGDSEHSQAAIGFIAAYNRAVVQAPSFPYRDICAVGLGKPAARYIGPITNWSEYARARDAQSTPPNGDVNATDVFNRTALEWASDADDEPMMLRLLAAGAKPNQPQDARAPSALALALKRRRPDLIAALIANGAKMTGQTQLCEQPFYAFVDDPAPAAECDWVGLLIATGREDLIGQAVADGGGGGLFPAFLRAIEQGDDGLARRLAPMVDGPAAAQGLMKVLSLGRSDLAMAMVVGKGGSAARSQTEERVWRAAAENQHAESLAFVFQYGADLNLLTADRAATCVNAAARGDDAALLGCVEEAGRRRLALVDQLEKGDFTGFVRGASNASDLVEDAKPTLLERAVTKADSATVRRLLDLGARPQTTRFLLNGQTDPQPYQGSLKAQADAQAMVSDYATASVSSGQLTTLQTAIQRRDAGLLSELSARGAVGLKGIATSQGMSGSLSVGLTDESRDVSMFPSRPSSEQFETLQLVIPVLAKEANGMASLEKLFWHAIGFGFDDVLELIVTSGFDPSRAVRPDRFWQAWSGLGSACKPSTGRLLVRYGVNARYPLDPQLNGWLPQKIVAAGCRNPDSAAVLVEAGLAPINELDDGGRTVLDEALARPYRPMMQVALRALGGLPGAEVDASGRVARMVELREGYDLDLEQSERE